MRRHRSLVLVPALLVSAACTRGDDATKSASSPLDRDLTLSAQLQSSATPASAGVELAAASGAACKVTPTPKAPTASQRAQAVALEQRAAEAEFVGNLVAARDLHSQAARLDGTSEEIAYRLARAEEASGDTDAAVQGYCRYLSLAPTAANAKDARARLSALLPPAAPTTRVAQQQQSAPQRAPTQVATQSPRTTRTVVARTTSTVEPARESAPATSAAVVTESQSIATVAPMGSGESTTGTPMGGEGTVASTSNGEVVGQQSQAEPVSAPREQQPVVRRGADHTMRNAAIGAAAGAAIGAVTGRSVKGAVIGGVAGGILGAVVGRAANASEFRTPGFAH